MALTVLQGLPRIGEEGFIFTTNGKTPVSGFSRAKSQIDQAMLSALRKANGEHAEGPKPWVFHDLRRTVATNLQKVGIRLEVTEAVLGHVSGSRAGIVGVYQRHNWAEEKRHALDAWARRLDEIVGGDASSNVFNLAEARGGERYA